MEKLDYSENCKDVATARRLIKQFRNPDSGRHEAKDEHEFEQGLRHVNNSPPSEETRLEQIRQIRLTERRIRHVETPHNRNNIQIKHFADCNIGDYTTTVNNKYPTSSNVYIRWVPPAELANVFDNPDAEPPMLPYWTFESVCINYPSSPCVDVLWKRIS